MKLGEKIKKDFFYALKDINFSVNEGEVLGIIGKNGAGKSTLLKVLSRITYPTDGQIKIRGRVASLLEVGTGFHPELTGRENIFLNGAILGMSRKEIKLKFDEIVSFSGVSKFIDTPVKHYSSGMYVRLAFSVAAHLEPEILVIDEVLAVGDAEFQKRCLGKMKDVASQGRTVLFVSHNMAAVKSFCTKSILLDKGEISFIGETDIAVGKYLKQNMNSKEGLVHYFDQQIFKNNESLSIDKFSIEESNGRVTEAFKRSDQIDYKIVLNPKNSEAYGVVFRFKDEEGNYLFVLSKDEVISKDLKSVEVKVSIPPNFFNEGTFYVDCLISQNKRVVFLENDCLSFQVILDAQKLGSWMGKTKGFLKA